MERFRNAGNGEEDGRNRQIHDSNFVWAIVSAAFVTPGSVNTKIRRNCINKANFVLDRTK